jgi:hypothetical protein
MTITKLIVQPLGARIVASTVRERGRKGEKGAGECFVAERKKRKSHHVTKVSQLDPPPPMPNILSLPLHIWGWIVAGFFATLACLVSFYLIYKHLRN